MGATFEGREEEGALARGTSAGRSGYLCEPGQVIVTHWRTLVDEFSTRKRLVHSRMEAGRDDLPFYDCKYVKPGKSKGNVQSEISDGLRSTYQTRTLSPPREFIFT